MLEILQVYVQTNSIFFTYFLVISVNCCTELLMKFVLGEILPISLLYSSKTAHKWFIWEKQIEFILYKICNYSCQPSKKILKFLDQGFSLLLLQDCLSVCTDKQKVPSNPRRFCTAAVNHSFHIWCHLAELQLYSHSIDYNTVSAVRTLVTQNRVMALQVS